MSRLKKLKGLLKKEGAEKPVLAEKTPEAKPSTTAKKEILEAEKEKMDHEALSKIVERMREKYIEEGVLKEGAEPGRASALKRMMEGEKKRLRVGASPRELALYENKFVKLFGKFYLILQSPISKLTNYLDKKIGRKLEFDLLASGMAYSIILSVIPLVFEV